MKQIQFEVSAHLASSRTNVSAISFKPYNAKRRESIVLFLELAITSRHNNAVETNEANTVRNDPSKNLSDFSHTFVHKNDQRIDIRTSVFSGITKEKKAFRWD